MRRLAYISLPTAPHCKESETTPIQSPKILSKAAHYMPGTWTKINGINKNEKEDKGTGGGGDEGGEDLIKKRAVYVQEPAPQGEYNMHALLTCTNKMFLEAEKTSSCR